MGSCYKEADRVKVAWFTPFNKESSIGRYSKFAAEALSKCVDIDIFAYCEEPQTEVPMHKTFLQVNYYSNTDVVGQLSAYDLCVYNMGDNMKYHAVLYDVYQEHAGILIQHDICMHNFFRGYYIVHKNDPMQYVTLLRKKYGTEAEKILAAANSSEKWSKIDLLKYNFSEDVFDNALGVVVHSQYHRKFLEQYYQGSVLVTPHLDINEWEVIDEAKEFNGYDRSKINILTVGMVNPNKHVDAVIEVLGKYPKFRSIINYTVIGSLGNEQYTKHLRYLIQKYELEDCVKLLGFVGHDELAYYYHYADFISNLRYPAFEGGSGSLVEQMSAGKGIIATNTGVYAEVPDECICKISPENMTEDLTRVFEKFSMNRDLIQMYEKNAKEYADNQFSRSLYAERLSKFFDEVSFTLPLYEVMDACKASIQCMNDTKIIDILAKEMEELYFEDNRSIAR